MCASVRRCLVTQGYELRRPFHPKAPYCKPIIFSPSRGVESTAKTLPFLATALVTMKESYLCMRVYVCLIITRRRVCQFYAPASGRMEDSTTVPETWSVVFCFLPPTDRTGNEYGRAHALMAMICDSFRQCLNI